MENISTLSKTTVLLFAVCILSASSLCQSSPPPFRLIDLGSHRLEIHTAGVGIPTVVIDSGLGDSMEKLQALQARIAQVTHVVAYNRAGYGRSEPGPLPRGCARETEELRALLEHASVEGPYVLVGHSYGALNLQLFASRYPDDVAGMVLLDPPPLSFILGEEYDELREMAEQMTREWQSIADSSSGSSNPQEQAQSSFLRMIASEHREMFGDSANQVGAISTFGDLPLVVIAAGKSNPAFGDLAEEFQAYWIEQSRVLAGKSSEGRFIFAEKSSHFLYLDEPELVAKSILTLVEETRASRGSNKIPSQE